MKKKFVIVGVLGTVVIGCAAALYATTGEQRAAASQLETYRKTVRDLGLPTTLSEVYPDEAVRPEENSAPLIIVAGELLSSEDSEQQDVIDALLIAASKPMCKFDWELAQKAGFVGSLMAVDAVALLLSSARDDVSDERHADAVRKIRAADKIASHIASIPTPDALAESARAEREMIVSLGDIMHEFPLDQKVMIIAQEIGKKTRPISVLQRSLRSQIAAGGVTVETIEESGLMEKLKLGFPADPWGASAVESRHREGWLDLYDGVKKIDDWPEAAVYLDGIAKEWSKDERPSSYTLRKAGSDFTEAAKLAAENVALRRVLFVAASAFEYKQLHKEFNPRTPVLGGLAVDPFRGRPLEYSALGTGFSIYSWGYDRVDSGGTTEPGLTFEDGDIGYRYSPFSLTDD